MSKAMHDAYLEAVYFTETGADNPENDGHELSKLFKAQAYFACRQFEDACRAMSIDLADYDMAQVGHDLWLTRNGHGAGFWDRPKIYGTANASLFTAFAKAQGEHYAEFVPEGSEDENRPV